MMQLPMRYAYLFCMVVHVCDQLYWCI